MSHCKEGTIFGYKLGGGDIYALTYTIIIVVNNECIARNEPH